MNPCVILLFLLFPTLVCVSPLFPHLYLLSLSALCVLGQVKVQPESFSCPDLKLSTVLVGKLIQRFIRILCYQVVNLKVWIQFINKKFQSSLLLKSHIAEREVRYLLLLISFVLCLIWELLWAIAILCGQYGVLILVAKKKEKDRKDKTSAEITTFTVEFNWISFIVHLCYLAAIV